MAKLDLFDLKESISLAPRPGSHNSRPLSCEPDFTSTWQGWRLETERLADHRSMQMFCGRAKATDGGHMSPVRHAERVVKAASDPILDADGRFGDYDEGSHTRAHQRHCMRTASGRANAPEMMAAHAAASKQRARAAGADSMAKTAQARARRPANAGTSMPPLTLAAAGQGASASSASVAAGSSSRPPTSVDEAKLLAWDRDPKRFGSRRRVLLQDARRTIACLRGVGRFDVPENAKEVNELLKRNLKVERDQALVENRWLCPVDISMGGSTADYFDEAGAAHAQGNQMRLLLRHPLTVMPQDELTPRETRAALGLTGEGWQDYSLSDMLKEGQ